MTVLLDESKSHSCPQGPLTYDSYGNATIAVENRSTELVLMDQDIDTCLIVFHQGRRFLRLVAYIYVLSVVNSLRIQVNMTGLPCNDPGLVVYHQLSTSEHAQFEFQECALTTPNAEKDAGQECGFVCHNVCPERFVVKISVQIERWLQKDNAPIKMCDMNVANDAIWKAL